MADPTTDVVRVHGWDLPVMRAGSGPDLLLLTGAYDGGDWQPYMAALAEDFRVIVPRHPGVGVELPAWLDTVGDLANFYLEFLAVERLTSVHLMGAALGGWIAAELATRNGTRLASLSLVAPFGARVMGAAGVDLFAVSDEQAIRHLVHDPAVAEGLIAQARDAAKQDDWLQTRVLIAKLCWQPRLHDPQLQKWLHRIDVPTLLIWGAADEVVPVAVADEWRQLVPQARLSVLAACGHLPTLEQPRVVADLVKGFAAERRIAA